MFVADTLSRLLAAHGVKRAVVSPGSRNAPLLKALADNPAIACHTVLDERVAAFEALGMALQSAAPVALVCTSGSAMLNYGPALAEAYYRHVPLVAVTADRPLPWIDQDDSQTIRQDGALANITKLSADLPSTSPLTADGRWMANRLVNDALLTALAAPRGPVHINVRLDLGAPEPPEAAAAAAAEPRVVRSAAPREVFARADLDALAARLRGRRVLFLAGFCPPDHRLSRAVAALAALPRCAVMTETVANLHAPRLLSRIDTLLSALTPDERRAMAPDTVVTFGGALVSRHVKDWLRSCPAAMEHWHVGRTLTTVDALRHLTLRVDASPAPFLGQLAAALRRQPAEDGGGDSAAAYAARWQALMARAAASHDAYTARAPWSDLRLFSLLIPRIPPSWNVHLSNGTPVRYAQLMDCSRLHRCECNRGVSGIDGATSTAAGAALASPSTPTLLVSGDLSAAYDSALLASGQLPPNMRMVVVDNGGGDIFRFIRATAAYPPDWRERALCLAGDAPLPAPGPGTELLTAASEQELLPALRRLFAAPADHPVVLVVTTPAAVNSRILTNYFSRQ